MLRRQSLAIRTYSSFRLRSLDAVRRAESCNSTLDDKELLLSEGCHVDQIDKSDEDLSLETLEVLWNQVSRHMYLRQLEQHNCFVMFRYAPVGQTGPVLPGDLSRLTHTLSNNYRHSSIIGTGSFNKKEFCNCFEDEVIPELGQNSLLLTQFLTVRNPTVLAKIMHIAERRHYKPSIIGVKAATNSLVPVKSLKPFLQDFSTMYADFTYDNLLKIATHKQTHSQKKLQYLLKSFGKFGITNPKITHTVHPSTKATWFLFAE